MENEVISCIHERRSVRHFKEMLLEREVLEKIVEAGMQAPNGHNMQTWKFTIISNESSEEVQNLKTVLDEKLKEKGTDSLYGFDNPSAVVIVTDRKDNYNAMANGACAIATMLLAAWSLGVGGCWVNALRTIQDEPEIRCLLGAYGIPDEHLVVGMVVMGYIEEELPKKPKRRKGVFNWVGERQL